MLFPQNSTMVWEILVRNKVEFCVWFKPICEGGLGLDASKYIYPLEMFAITTALKVFGPHLTGCKVILKTDNRSTRDAINKQSTHLECCMELIHELITLQIIVEAEHILGVDNVESDAISRSRIDKFLADHPTSRKHEIAITTKWWPPSWKPSKQLKYSGVTRLQRTPRSHSSYSNSHAKVKASRWN